MPNTIDLLNYKEKLKKLEKEKVELKKLDKNSDKFKTSLKKYIEELIFLKCHAFCMDKKEERDGLLKIIWQEMESFKLI
jgi:hypothetical protein